MGVVQTIAGATLASLLALPALAQTPVLQLRRCGQAQQTIALQRPLTTISSNPTDPWEYFTAGIKQDSTVLPAELNSEKAVYVSGQARIYSSSIRTRQVLELEVNGEAYRVSFVPSPRKYTLCPANPEFGLRYEPHAQLAVRTESSSSPVRSPAVQRTSAIQNKVSIQHRPKHNSVILLGEVEAWHEQEGLKLAGLEARLSSGDWRFGLAGEWTRTEYTPNINSASVSVSRVMAPPVLLQVSAVMENYSSSRFSGGMEFVIELGKFTIAGGGTVTGPVNDNPAYVMGMTGGLRFTSKYLDAGASVNHQVGDMRPAGRAYAEYDERAYIRLYPLEHLGASLSLLQPASTGKLLFTYGLATRLVF